MLLLIIFLALGDCMQYLDFNNTRYSCSGDLADAATLELMINSNFAISQCLLAEQTTNTANGAAACIITNQTNEPQSIRITLDYCDTNFNFQSINNPAYTVTRDQDTNTTEVCVWFAPKAYIPPDLVLSKAVQLNSNVFSYTSSRLPGTVNPCWMASRPGVNTVTFTVPDFNQLPNYPKTIAVIFNLTNSEFYYYNVRMQVVLDTNYNLIAYSGAFTVASEVIATNPGDVITVLANETNLLIMVNDIEYLTYIDLPNTVNNPNTQLIAHGINNLISSISDGFTGGILAGEPQPLNPPTYINCVVDNDGKLQYTSGTWDHGELINTTWIYSSYDGYCAIYPVRQTTASLNLTVPVLDEGEIVSVRLMDEDTQEVLNSGFEIKRFSNVYQLTTNPDGGYWTTLPGNNIFIKWNANYTTLEILHEGQYIRQDFTIAMPTRLAISVARFTQTTFLQGMDEPIVKQSVAAVNDSPMDNRVEYFDQCEFDVGHSLIIHHPAPVGDQTVSTYLKPINRLGDKITFDVPWMPLNSYIEFGIIYSETADPESITESIVRLDGLNDYNMRIRVADLELDETMDRSMLVFKYIPHLSRIEVSLPNGQFLFLLNTTATHYPYWKMRVVTTDTTSIFLPIS